MLHIIINPTSSGGQSLKVWHKIEPRFASSGRPYKVHMSTLDRSIEQICAEITSDGSDNTLFLLGGDGSLNEAVNGIRDFEKTRVGFLQVGSGNDMGRDMQLPRDRDRIIDAVLEGRVLRRLDVGEVLFHDRTDILPGMEDPQYARRLFNVGCGIGFDAECCHAAAASRFKSVLNLLRLGKLIYIASAIRLIFTSQMADCDVTFEGEDDRDMSSGLDGDGANTGGDNVDNTSRPVGTVLHYNRLLFAAFMNHQYQGGGFQFCPHASADDGRLDLCTASDIHRPQFFRIFPHAYKGGHIRYPGVTEERGAAFTLCADRPLWVQTDGEVSCRSSHISVRVLPGRLQIVQ